MARIKLNENYPGLKPPRAGAQSARKVGTARAIVHYSFRHIWLSSPTVFLFVLKKACPAGYNQAFIDHAANLIKKI